MTRIKHFNLKLIGVFTGIQLLLTCLVYGQTGNTYLTDDTLTIEEVVVSGTRIEVARRNVPMTVSLITRDEIEMTDESAVFSVLSHRVPGLFVTERGVTGFGLAEGSAGLVSIRGLGGTAPNTQVLVLIDGHPQFQGIFGHSLPDAYVASDVEKVEVVRGPASILYGSHAMAGAINIITRKQEKEGFSGNARVSYGTYNTQKYMASGGLKKDRFHVFASVNHDRTDGHRDSSEFKIINAYVKAGYALSENITLMADVGIADFESQNPGTIYAPSFFGIDVLRGKASFAVNNKFEGIEGGLIAFYNFGTHEFTNDWISKDYNAGISFYQGLQFFPGNRLTVGFDYKNFGGEANSGMAPNQINDITEIAGYAFMQQSLLNMLILNAGLRLENSSFYGTEPVPQAGFSFHASPSTTIKGSVSKGFRSPTVMETYLFAPNPDLKPERLMSYDIGIGQYFLDRNLRVEISGFLMNGNNIIEVRPNENPPPQMIRQNVGDFSNKGFEAEVTYQLNHNLIIYSNYSYVNTIQPRLAVPEHQVFLEGNYRFEKLRFNIGLSQVMGLYSRLGNEANGVSSVQDDYTLLSAKIAYQVFNFAEIYLSGKNLLDQKYEINHGYPMPGITIFAGINLKIN